MLCSTLTGMCYVLSMAQTPLTDRDVYDLLHEAQLLLLNKVVITPHARDVLSMAIRDLSIMQTALLSLSERQDRPRNENGS